MMFVYAISSKIQQYIYVGITNDVDDRFERHNRGREKTTRVYKPFNLIFLVTVDDRITARLIEVYLKSGIGKEFLKSLK